MIRQRDGGTGGVPALASGASVGVTARGSSASAVGCAVGT